MHHSNDDGSENIKLVSPPAVSFGIFSSLKEPASVPASSGHVEPVDKGKQTKNVKTRDERQRERHDYAIDEQEAEHALSLNSSTRKAQGMLIGYQHEVLLQHGVLLADV